MFQYTAPDKVELIKKVHSEQTVHINHKWLGYLKDKEAVIRLLKGNQPLVDILLDVLTKEYETELRQPRGDYNTPNWALLQADKSGYKRAIENFINLLTIKD